MKWSKRRRRELEKLRQLLVEVSAMNHGSHVSDRIVRCEKLANALHSIKLNLKDPNSFYQFLVGLVIAEGRRGTAMQKRSDRTGAKKCD